MESFDISRFDPMAQGPAGVRARFYNKLVPDPLATKEQGRPMYKEQLFIEKAILGTNDVIDRPAFEKDFEEWPRQYDRFVKTEGKSGEIEGTPLSECPLFGRTRIAELNALNILTVEQFVSLNDSAMSRCGAGTRKEIEKAKGWISLAKDTANVTKAIDDLHEVKLQLQSALEENEELRKELKKLKAKGKTNVGNEQGE